MQSNLACFRALYSPIQFVTITLLYPLFPNVDPSIIIPISVSTGRTLPYPRIQRPTASLISKEINAY
ncbi:hypothetical protein EDC04DRAFT_2691145 [Pisolithus marmoratus]|nr:hypothetical protein EDC04DRAFT_2691145 [Pisolithus marmoratus]